MNKYILTISIIAVTLFIIPSQTSAKWWNPVSWFEKQTIVTEQNTESLSEDINQIKQPQTEVVTNVVIEDTSVEALKAEIASLRNDFNNLYTEYNKLVKKYDTLLKNSDGVLDLNLRIINLENKINDGSVSNNSKTQTDTSNFDFRVKKLEAQINGGSLNGGTEGGMIGLNTRVTDLEKKIESICTWIFSSWGCPTSNPSTSGSINDRLKRLE